MKGHQVTSWRRFVGPRPKWARTTLITLWCQPSTSFRSIFITLIGLRNKWHALGLILLLLWAMLRVGVYLILLVLLAFVALLFIHLWELRFSPHSTLPPYSMRDNGAT